MKYDAFAMPGIGQKPLKLMQHTQRLLVKPNGQFTEHDGFEPELILPSNTAIRDDCLLFKPKIQDFNAGRGTAQGLHFHHHCA